jgi:hypothetical protein
MNLKLNDIVGEVYSPDHDLELHVRVKHLDYRIQWFAMNGRTLENMLRASTAHMPHGSLLLADIEMLLRSLSAAEVEA